jgi:hypothetical protein
MELLIGPCRHAAETFAWNSLAAPMAALVGVVATILWGIRTARKTLRANILTTYRLQWLDLFRIELPQLLALGERLYHERYAGDAESRTRTWGKLRFVSKRLIVLMGREDELRLEFAETVRRFADEPTSELADELEVLAQRIYRERWNQVRTETGEPPRDRSPLPRPTADVAPPGDSGAEPK